MNIPTVGTAATIRYYSDRKAGTIIGVSKSGFKVTVQEDKATRVDSNGMSECQEYTYAPDPEGETHVFFRNAAGEYKERGTRLTVGTRNHYHDYSF